MKSMAAIASRKCDTANLSLDTFFVSIFILLSPSIHLSPSSFLPTVFVVISAPPPSALLLHVLVHVLVLLVWSQAL